MFIPALFTLCLIATLIAGAMHYYAIRFVEYHPAAQKEVRSTAHSLPGIGMILVVLYFIGTNMDGVLPGFGPMVMTVFIVTVLGLGWHNVSYARQHQPAIA